MDGQGLFCGGVAIGIFRDSFFLINIDVILYFFNCLKEDSNINSDHCGF